MQRRPNKPNPKVFGNYGEAMLHDATLRLPFGGYALRSNPVSAAYSIPHLLVSGKAEKAAEAVMRVLPPRISMRRNRPAVYNRDRVLGISRRLELHATKINAIMSEWLKRPEVHAQVLQIVTMLREIDYIERVTTMRPHPEHPSREVRVVVRRGDRWVHASLDHPRFALQKNALAGGLNTFLNSKANDPRLRPAVGALSDLFTMLPVDRTVLAHAVILFHSQVKVK